MLRILADRNINFAEEAFDGIGQLRCVPSSELIHLKEVDILLTRSSQRITDENLEGSPVRFLGTATVGTDHLDLEALRRRNITFTNAPASNSDSVVEWVLTVLLTLADRKQSPLAGKKIGIIGCGNIGSRLIKRLPPLGVELLLNDPPLAETVCATNTVNPFVTLETLLQEADIVTLHVPLAKEAPHPTHHLLDLPHLQMMKPGSWLINASRGPVVSTEALKSVLQSGRLGAVALDVWEYEPRPDPKLLNTVDLASAHIAGYSIDAKVQGTYMVYEALMRFLGRPAEWDPEEALRRLPEINLDLEAPAAELNVERWLSELVRQAYPVLDDDRRIRKLVDLPTDEHAAYFKKLRSEYPYRRTFSRYTVHGEVSKERQRIVEQVLEFKVVDE